MIRSRNTEGSCQPRLVYACRLLRLVGQFFYVYSGYFVYSYIYGEIFLQNKKVLNYIV